MLRQSPQTPASVVIVDDDSNQLVALAAILGGTCDLRLARTGREALRLARLEPPDLVLLDVELPDIDGYEVCRRLKLDPLTSDLPVVFLTSHHDEKAEIKALRGGAADFIGKPPREAVVQARVANLVRMKRMADQLRSEATTDGLTGLANRSQLDRTIHIEWLRAVRGGHSLAVLMVDVDHFKAYNDHNGHLAGDGALRKVAAALKGSVHRPADVVARYGGEEFMFLLPETDLAGAGKVARAAREAVLAAQLPHPTSPVQPLITVSIGMSALHETHAGHMHRAMDSNFMVENTSPGPEDLVAAADLALYEAKRSGRNQAWAKEMGEHEAVLVEPAVGEPQGRN